MAEPTGRVTVSSQRGCSRSLCEIQGFDISARILPQPPKGRLLDQPAMTMEQIEKTMATMRNNCAAKMNADIDIVLGIQKGEFPDDRPLKCYTHCIMKMMRTFKNGRIDDVMMIKQLDMMIPPDLAVFLKQSTTACAAEPPTGDDCETCFNFVKCSYNKDPEHFFFP